MSPCCKCMYKSMLSASIMFDVETLPRCILVRKCDSLYLSLCYMDIEFQSPISCMGFPWRNSWDIYGCGMYGHLGVSI